MSFTVITAPQRSEAWYLARLARVTGSRAADLLATIKTGEAAARRDYKMELVTEHLTGQPCENGYVNDVMRRGIELEPEARTAFEGETGLMVRETGFLSHNTLMVGCSLDGDIDDFREIVELKVPNAATHFRWMRDGKVPAEHMPQITHNLWVSGAEACWFCSYDPRFPLELRTFVVRVERIAAVIDAYAEKVLAFIAEVEREVAAAKGWRVLMEKAIA